MPRSVSAAELLEIVQQGGQVDREENSTEIFSQVLNELRNIVEAQQESVEQQRTLSNQILSKLTNILESAQDVSVDFSPIEGLVRELVAMNNIDKPSYEFHVERNSRGFLTGMTAKPKNPTIN